MLLAQLAEGLIGVLNSTIEMKNLASMNTLSQSKILSRDTS
jgi:hypothetical protein